MNKTEYRVYALVEKIEVNEDGEVVEDSREEVTAEACCSFTTDEEAERYASYLSEQSTSCHGVGCIDAGK